MRSVVLGFFALLVPVVVLAGPNAGGTLVVHDTGLFYSGDVPAYPSAVPECEEIDSDLPLDFPTGAQGVVWKVYAAFPVCGSGPRLKAFVMGSAFPEEVVVLAGGVPDPVADFEIPQDGWPYESGGGVGIAFGTVKTDPVNEVYWLGGYAYATGVLLSVTPHPVGETIFVDDSVPGIVDPVAGFGSIGFGVTGVTPCPVGGLEGACCFTDGTCEMLCFEDCEPAGGVFLDGSCDPNPCEDLTPGACCLPSGECVFLGQSSCYMLYGTYVGPLEPCTPTLCLLGACCIGNQGECIVATEWECMQIPGWMFFIPEWNCDPNPCIAPPVKETTWGQLKREYAR